MTARQDLQNSWIVLKFGGTSVCQLNNWRTIAGQIRGRRTSNILIVCSAISGASNLLQIMIKEAKNGGVLYQKIQDKFLRLHENLALALAVELSDLQRTICHSR